MHQVPGTQQTRTFEREAFIKIYNVTRRGNSQIRPQKQPFFSVPCAPAHPAKDRPFIWAYLVPFWSTVHADSRQSDNISGRSQNNRPPFSRFRPLFTREIPFTREGLRRRGGYWKHTLFPGQIIYNAGNIRLHEFLFSLCNHAHNSFSLNWCSF